VSLFRPATFLSYLLDPVFAIAAFNTLWISLSALVVGVLLGLALAVGQEARFVAVRWLVTAYVWLFRGTPVLLQIVFAFNVLPSLGIVLSGYTCAILALGLNEGAYMAEIMRSGIRAVSLGQRSAARALGLEDWQIMRWIILPQAMRVIIPPVGNQFIGMLKLSALISVIGVNELLLTADQAASTNFRYFEALSAAGIYYLALTTLFMLIQNRIEVALRRRASSAPGQVQVQGASSRGVGT
jgi:polar amino acid transport system permease protein